MRYAFLIPALVAALMLAACGGGASAPASNPVAPAGTPAPPSPPSAPTGVAAIAGDTQVQLSWNVVSGATAYNIYYSTVSGVTAATGNKVANAVPGSAVSGLINGTTYYFVVTALNANGESAVSSEVSAKPLPSLPAAPTGVSSVAGDTQVQLSWTAVTGATSYNVYYSTASGVTPASGAKVAGASSGGAVTGLTNGTTYYFIVTAMNLAGESAASSTVSATPNPPPPSVPTAPAGVTANAGDGQVQVSWAAVSGATSYNVYYSSSPAVTTASGTKVAGAVSGSNITGLTNGTAYYFIVTAVNISGESAASTTVSATPLAAPGGVIATAGDNQVQLNWNAVTGATSYNIYYSTASGVTATNGIKVANAASGDFITSLDDGKTYYFVVTEVSASGESAVSAEVNATPVSPAGTWATMASINEQRDNAANVVANVNGVNTLYVLGGAPAGSSILSSMEKNTPPFTATWTYAASMPAWTTFPIAPPWSPTTTPAAPTYRYSPAAASYGGLIYLAGGTDQVNGQGPIYPIAVYDPTLNTWSDTVPANAATTAANTAGKMLAPLPTGRWGFDMAVIDGKLYAVGGAVHVPGNITTKSATKITGATSAAPVVSPAGTTISLVNGSHYYFFVTSVDASGVESAPSNMVSALINGSDSSIAGNGQAALTWAAYTGTPSATSYNLYYSSKSGLMPADSTGSLPAGVTKLAGITATTPSVSATVTGLTNGTPYYFIATAVTSKGEVLATNQEISVIPQAASPISNLSVVSGNGQATLSWSPATGAASYNIYYDTGNNIYYGTVEMYDPVLNTWTTRAAMPTPRWGPTVVVVNGMIYAIGGWGGWPELSVVEAYDPVANAWSTTVPSNPATLKAGTAGQPFAKMPTARDDFGFAVLNGQIYAIGGDINAYDATAGTACCTQVVEAYDTVMNTWTTKTQMTTMRDDFDASMVDGSIYAVAGSRDGTFTNPSLQATIGGGYSLTTVEAYTTTAATNPVPTGVSATAVTGQVTLAWNAVAGAVSYNIYWSDKAGVSTVTGTKIANGTATSYPHTGLTKGKWYHYIVTAVTSTGESLPSNEVTVQAQ